MPRAVGLEIGRTSIKIAAVDAGSRRTRLLGFACRDLDPTLPEEDRSRQIRRAMEDLFKEGRFDRASVVCSMDSDACIIRDITVPFKSKEQIDKIIRYEAEHHLVATSIEEVIVDYMKVGEIGEKSRLLLVAAKKEKLRERLDLMQEQGIDPLHFDLDAVAIYNAVAATPLADQHDNYVIVDVGLTQLLTMVVEERGLAHVRTSRMGADSMSGVSSTDPRSGDPANLVEMEAGEQPTPQELERARRAYLDRMLRVLKQFLMGVRLRNPPEVIILTGDGSRQADIVEALKQEFELPVQAVDFASQLELESTLSSEYSDRLDTGAAAIGLALKGAGVDRGQMNFRKEEMAFMRRFEQVRVHLVALSLMAFLIAFVPAAYFYKLKDRTMSQYDLQFTQGRLKGQETPDRGVLPEFADFLSEPVLVEVLGKTDDQLDSDLAKVVKSKPRSRMTKVKSLLADYEEALNELEGENEGIPPIESAFGVMGKIFDRISEGTRSSNFQKDPIRIYEFDISTRQCQIRFWAPQTKDAETVLATLKKTAPEYFLEDPARGWRFTGRLEEKDGGVVATVQADRVREDE